MKKIISLMLVLVMIFSMAAISFAGKPVKVADFDEQQNEYQNEYQHGQNGMPYGLDKKEVLPYGLSKREVLPFGLLKMQLDDEITFEDIEVLILDINEYIEEIDEESTCEFTIIEAINLSIERINLELLKEEPELNDLFYHLSRKFEILKRQVVDCEEEINYVDELTTLKEELEEILDNDELSQEDEDAIEVLISDIELLLLEDEITEEEYDAIVERALEYIETEAKEEVIDETKLDELINDITDFIIENEFGDEIGEFSLEQSNAIYNKIIAYDPNDVDDDAVYDELLADFENLKLTEIVAGSYLIKVNDYKILLASIVTEDFTEDELLEYDALMVLVDLVITNEKMTLGEFNIIESQTVGFILDIDYYILELDTLIDEARDLILNNPIDLNDKDLFKSRMEFVIDFLNVLKLKSNAETISDYQEAIEFLEEAMELYQLELDK